MIFHKEYKINTNLYDYVFTGGELTSKKTGFIRNLHPTIGVSFRPFNLMADGNLGIIYTNHKVNYEVGGAIFYYPMLQNKPGYDIYFRISYTL